MPNYAINTWHGEYDHSHLQDVLIRFIST